MGEVARSFPLVSQGAQQRPAPRLRGRRLFLQARWSARDPQPASGRVPGGPLRLRPGSKPGRREEIRNHRGEMETGPSETKEPTRVLLGRPGCPVNRKGRLRGSLSRGFEIKAAFLISPEALCSQSVPANGNARGLPEQGVRAAVVGDHPSQGHRPRPWPLASFLTQPFVSSLSEGERKSKRRA